MEKRNKIIFFLVAGLMSISLIGCKDSAKEELGPQKAIESESKSIEESLEASLIPSPSPVSGSELVQDDKSLAKEIFESLTLEEKVAQMLMPDCRTYFKKPHTSLREGVKNAIEQYKFGGIILFSENAETTEGTARLICDMQAASEIPMLIAIDEEGGQVVRLNTGTATVGNMALGAIGRVDAVEESAAIIGAELTSLGIHINFGPVMDINNNPANPVIGVRSFSDNPIKVAEMGCAYIDGLHNTGVLSALKHFPGHGDTNTDSHTGLPVINKTLEELKVFELIPFQAGIDKGADIIMTAHISYPAIEKNTYTSISSGEEIALPATLSRTIITDILRNDMGFEGVVCSDSFLMKALADNFDLLDATALAINAGIDIILMPLPLHSPEEADAYGEYISSLCDMVKEGVISEDNINASVMRILSLKEKAGILAGVETSGDIQSRIALETVGSREHHDREWELAKEAATLVKGRELLPLKGKSLILCSRDSAVNEAEFAFNHLTEIPDYCSISFQGKKEMSSEIREAIEETDNIIITVSTTSPLDFTESDTARIIDEIIEYAHNGGKSVSLISTNLPYDLARYQEADMLIAVYCSKGMEEIPTEYKGETKSYGANIAAGIYGAMGGFDFTGKLPVTIPKLNENYEFIE